MYESSQLSWKNNAAQAQRPRVGTSSRPWKSFQGIVRNRLNCDFSCDGHIYISFVFRSFHYSRAKNKFFLIWNVNIKSL